jgi:hypothetical protein
MRRRSFASKGRFGLAEPEGCASIRENAEFITKNKELKMTDLNKFFKALSERAYKENDLSDVTYSMCESNKVFRQFFLDFFFRSFNIDAHAVTITREYATEWGRPDFYIRSGDK